MPRKSRRSRIVGIATRVLIVAAAAAPALAAQGAKATNTRDQVSSSATSRAGSRLQPARSILGSLVGKWRFEIWFAGNFDGPPDGSGMRVVRPLFDGLCVEWTEALDHSPLEGRGIVGFDASSGRFFSNAVYSAGAAPELLTGVLGDAQPSIDFRPISGSPGTGEQPAPAATLAVLDPDHFTWVAADGAWRVVFTRQPDR